MAVGVIMPKQGQSVESCVITKWHKSVGDEVKTGELLFSYETDKAAFDEEAKAEGKLLAILANEGDDVPCLNTVCVIGKDGEDISAYTSHAPQAEAAPKEEPKQADERPVIETGQTIHTDERVFVSPRAKAAAQRQGVDAALAAPTGPNGRIMERDIYRLAEQCAKAPLQDDLKQKVTSVMDYAKSAGESQTDYTDEKLSNVRKVIARSMVASLSAMAQLTNHSSFDASKILEFRKRVKLKGKEMDMEDITLNDIILFAVSRVLKTHPVINAHFLDDHIRYFHSVHLGIAVDTERGLLVPTLYNADRKSLNQISLETKELIKAAQSGKIHPDLLKNGTFTVSNLGSQGVESFTPIINPPQTAILGVNTIIKRIREVNGAIEAYPAIGLSLTYDHRAVDGAPAAKFTQELASALENFDLMLAL